MQEGERAGLSFRPLRLARKTSDQLRAANQVVQTLRQLPVHWGGKEWRLTMTPLWGSETPAGHHEPLDSIGWSVDLIWGQRPVRILLPPSAPEAWVAASFPGLDLPRLPAAVAAAVIETAVRAAIQPLSELGWGDFQVKGIESSASATHSLEERCYVQLETEETRLQASLSTDAQGLAHLARCLADLPRGLGPLSLARLPIVLRAEIGFSRLPLEEWSQVQAGDAVLIDRPLLGADGELWLAAGAWGLRARPEGGVLRVTAPWKKEGWAVDMFEDDEALDRLDSIRGVPMRVAFDIGEVRLSAGDLESLQVGHALDLGRPLSEAVTIRINGARVGHGELVDIDGRLGVVVRDLIDRDLEQLPWSEVHADTELSDLGDEARDMPDPEPQQDEDAHASDIEIDLPPPEA